MSICGKIFPMEITPQARLVRLPLLFALAAVAGLVVAACSGGEEKPSLPAQRTGNTITLTVTVIMEKDIIYYQDTDFAIYALTPSDSSRKLAAIRVQAFNGKSNTVSMNVDEEGYALLDKDAKEYKSLNPFGESRRLSPNLPSGEELHQFIWGNFEIPKGNGIEAWTVFDIPKDVEPYQLRWRALETIFVPFFPIG